ncbi:hypothetical protein QYE76_029856 [Lolium multiflorum]|uniref:Uncharacterized protein n=1 Tax=Lolium multiflorum TaxID=4521 RepID=A0AAD8VIP7_LOLMU|nr:hypothetical protein QYE76_029856 [Lolium multiflorum]
MENYSLLMGDSIGDEDGGGVDGGAFGAHCPGVRSRDSCPRILAAMAAATEVEHKANDWSHPDIYLVVEENRSSMQSILEEQSIKGSKEEGEFWRSLSLGFAGKLDLAIVSDTNHRRRVLCNPQGELAVI